MKEPLFDSRDLVFGIAVAIVFGIVILAGMCWLDSNFIGISALGDQGVPG